jgi:peptidoglycan hydrolase-like protein with peptidoglycan-binding domain
VSDVPRALAQLDAEYARLRPPPPEEPVNSEQVKAVQQALNELGWVPALKVDGVYGPLTDAAVKGIATRQATRFEATAEAAAYRVRTAKDAALVSIEQQAESIKQAAKAAQG